MYLNYLVDNIYLKFKCLINANICTYNKSNPPYQCNYFFVSKVFKLNSYANIHY